MIKLIVMQELGYLVIYSPNNLILALQFILAKKKTTDIFKMFTS